MPQSVFILSTASQAFFLSMAPDLVRDSILILTVKSKKDADEILGYLSHLKWKKIYTWSIPKSNRKDQYLKFLVLRLKLLRFKRTYPNIKRVYFGSYVNQYHLSLLAEYEHQADLFLLYDGLQMIAAAELRKVTKEHIPEHPVLMDWMRFKVPVIHSLNYISPISLNISKRDTLHLIKSSNVSSKRSYNPNLVFFIGQPIVDIGIVSRSFYLNTLKNLLTANPHKKVVYIPHPREKRELLSAVEDIMEVKHLDTIFEKYFLQTEVFPQQIYSFYSSVLLNLIFLRTESQIFSIKIPLSELGKEYRYKIEPVYNYFHEISDRNFEVVELQKMILE